MTETEESRRIKALVASWRERQQQDGDCRQLQQLITSWCASATVRGIPVARQLEMLRLYGIALGGGGHDRNPDALACEYCGATGGGGHGGLCPNGSTGINGGPGGPSSGGGGGGALGALPLPAEESQP
jgi:hypothetical protein